MVAFSNCNPTLRVSFAWITFLYSSQRGWTKEAYFLYNFMHFFFSFSFPSRNSAAYLIPTNTISTMCNNKTGSFPLINTHLSVVSGVFLVGWSIDLWLRATPEFRNKIWARSVTSWIFGHLRTYALSRGSFTSCIDLEIPKRSTWLHKNTVLRKQVRE